MRVLAGQLILLAMLSAGCGGPPVDLTKGLEIVDASTGWYDAGPVNGQNKLVPSISFTLKNISDQPLVALQINAVFRRLNDKDEWGSAFIAVTKSDGLPPGATSQPITINSQLGYTGTDPRAQMLQNSQFVDAKVDLFAKYASLQWVRIGERPIERRLITR
jgi:hypothetical protein